MLKNQLLSVIRLGNEVEEKKEEPSNDEPLSLCDLVGSITWEQSWEMTFMPLLLLPQSVSVCVYVSVNVR